MTNLNGNLSNKHRRIENGMNDDDDEIAEVFNSEGNAEVLTHKDDNDMFKVHGDVQFLADNRMVLRQSIIEYLDAVNDNVDKIELSYSDAYEQFDYSDGDGYIQYVYSLMDINNGTMSVFSGVLYNDGRIAVVGVNRDHWADSYDDMIRTLISGL